MGIFAKSKGAGLLDDRYSVVKKIKSVLKTIFWITIIIVAIIFAMILILDTL